MRTVLAIAFACLFATGCQFVASTGALDVERDAVVERAWLADPAGTLTPEAALGGLWTPFTGSLTRGFTASDTWLRLRLDPAAASRSSLASDRRLVLRIMPGHLDEIAVYRVDRLTEPPVLLGDRHLTVEPLEGLGTYPVLFAEASAPFEVLVRIRTQSNHGIHVQALSWDDAIEANGRQRTVIFTYLVFALMVIAFALMSWLEDRDTTMALFIVHQCAAVLIALSLLGVLRQYGPSWLLPALDRLTSLSIAGGIAVSLQFHVRMFTDLGAGQRETRLIRATSVFPALGAVLIATGQVRYGLMLTQFSQPISMLCLCITAWSVGRSLGPEDTRSRLGRAYVRGVYVLMMILTVPNSMRVVGLASARRLTDLWFLSYAVLSAILVGGLLVVRARAAAERNRRARVALVEAQREAETAHARATEQSELLTMLTHELKTPLSVVSLALGESGQTPRMRERALRAITNMSGVIDRCSQTAIFDDSLADRDATPTLAPLDLGEVLADAVDAQFHGERIDFQATEGLPRCTADRQMLSIIVANLLENALKYGPPEGRVRASITPAPHEGRPGLSLRVANRLGPAGRPDPAHLFEKYHRGAHARHSSGSGLGLYLSYRMAQKFGGRLQLCEDTEGKNEVEFELWLPC